ncbi:MAG: HpcH/HpaI aldolase family protein [Eubacteriales bacterium]
MQKKLSHTKRKDSKLIRKNKVKKILQSSGTAFGTFVSFMDPAVVEIMGHIGFDFVVIDNEHVSMDKNIVVNMMRASEIEGAGIMPFVRVKEGSDTEILQALDAGAMGIQIPGVDTYEQAKQITQAMYYQPKGNRGMGSGQRGIGYGFMDRFEYFEMANEEILTIIQCESIESVHNIDKILTIEEVDIIFVGAMDLSCSMGPEIMGRRNHPELVKVFNETVKKIIDAGKIAGASVGDASEIQEMKDLGVRYMSVGIDLAFLKSAAKRGFDLCKNIVKGN